MARWLKGHLRRYMIGPIVQKTFSRFLYALALALLWNRFVNTAGLRSIDHAYTVVGMFFFALAWVDYLRLDGIRFPLIDWFGQRTRKRSSGPFDYVDEEVVTYEGLAQEDRGVCSLLAHVICGIVFLLLSIM